jgi:hypothetical protein
MAGNNPLTGIYNWLANKTGSPEIQTPPPQTTSRDPASPNYVPPAAPRFNPNAPGNSKLRSGEAQNTAEYDSLKGKPMPRIRGNQELDLIAQQSTALVQLNGYKKELVDFLNSRSLMSDRDPNSQRGLDIWGHAKNALTSAAQIFSGGFDPNSENPSDILNGFDSVYHKDIKAAATSLAYVNKLIRTLGEKETVKKDTEAASGVVYDEIIRMSRQLLATAQSLDDEIDETLAKQLIAYIETNTDPEDPKLIALRAYANTPGRWDVDSQTLAGGTKGKVVI